MKLNPSFKFLARFSVLGLLISLLFQNCGPSFVLIEPGESALNSSLAEGYFKYPYSAAPVYYTELMLFQESNAVEKLKTFKFLGMASFVRSRNTSLDYKVQFLDADKVENPADPTAHLICPTLVGTLAPGQSTITADADCVTVRETANIKVVLTLQAKGYADSLRTIEKLYSK